MYFLKKKKRKRKPKRIGFNDFRFLHFNIVFFNASLMSIKYHQCRLELYSKETSNLCEDFHPVSEQSFQLRRAGDHI